MSLLKTIENDVKKGATFIGKLGKAFVRNATGGDIKMILKPKSKSSLKKGAKSMAKPKYYPRKP